MTRMFEGLFSGGLTPPTTPTLSLGDIEDTVKKYSTEYGVDYDFASALIHQESGGDPTVQPSGAGAVGLMQIIPPTARAIAKELGEEYSYEKLKDPETNIRWGIYHIKSLQDKFGGDEMKIAAAYHAGEGSVRKAEKQGKRVPDTYDPHAGISTKDYVRSILSKKGTPVSYKDFEPTRMFAGLFEGEEWTKREPQKEPVTPKGFYRIKEKPKEITPQPEPIIEEPQPVEEGVPPLIAKPPTEETEYGTTEGLPPALAQAEPLPEDIKPSPLPFERREPAIADIPKETVALTRGLVAEGVEAVIGIPAVVSKIVSGMSGAFEDFIAGGDPVEGFKQGWEGERDIFGKSAKRWEEMGDKWAEAIRGEAKTKGEEFQQSMAGTMLNAYFILHGGTGILKQFPKTGKYIKNTAQGIVEKAKLSSKTLKKLKLTTEELVNVKKAHSGAEGMTVENLTPRERAFFNHVIKDAHKIRADKLRTGELKDIVYPWEPPAWGKIKKVKPIPKERVALPAPMEYTKPVAKIEPKNVDDMVENLLAEGGIITPKAIAEGKVPKSELVKTPTKEPAFIPKGKMVVAEGYKPTEAELVANVKREIKKLNTQKTSLEKDIAKVAEGDKPFLNQQLKMINTQIADKNKELETFKVAPPKPPPKPKPPPTKIVPPKKAAPKVTPEKELLRLEEQKIVLEDRLKEAPTHEQGGLKKQINALDVRIKGLKDKLRPPPAAPPKPTVPKPTPPKTSPASEVENISEELNTKKPPKPNILDQKGAVTLPTKEELAVPVSKVGGVVDTELPFRLAGAPEMGRAVKLLPSRMSVGDEKAIDFVKKGTKDIQPKKIKTPITDPKTQKTKDIELSEDAVVFFSTANPKHLDKLPPEDKTRLQKVVAEFNKMNKKYETELTEMGVLQRGWPESAIVRNKERIEALKKEMVSKRKRKVKKIVDEINQLTEDNKVLAEMKYMHFPSRIWIADKYENDPEAFRAILTGTFKGIKGRKTIDPYDLVEAGVLDPSKVSAKEAMAVYMRYVDHQKAQVAIRDTGIMEKVVIPIDEAPASFVDMGNKYPLFAGYKVHPMVAEHIANSFDLVGTRQGSWEKFMSVTKMLQFYNPLIMPMYDAFQASALTQFRFMRPKHFKKAVVDVFKKTPAYYEAADNGLYSKPYRNPFSEFKKSLERTKEGETFLSSVKYELKRLGKNLPMALPRALADIYTASWNTAWFGDKILRMASYNVLRNQGLSPKDAAKFAAEAHADYAGVPAKTRKTLNKVLFTPTFQIAMLKWFTKMFASTLRAPASTVARITKKPLGKEAGKDWLRMAEFATIIGGLFAIDYGLIKFLGWAREEFGRKYTKNVEYMEKDKLVEKQVVVTLSNPWNVPLKYYYTFMKRKPGMTRMQQFAKYGKYWLHPFWKLSMELSQNKRPNGDPIANPWTSPTRQLIDTGRYIAANMFSMYRGLIDEPENTKAEALKTLRKAKDNPFNQMLRPITFMYVRDAEDKRTARYAERLLRDFNRAFVDRPPRTKKELETMYRNLEKALDDLEKKAIGFESMKAVLQSKKKVLEDKLIFEVFFEKEPPTKEEVGEIRKGISEERKRRR